VSINASNAWETKERWHSREVKNLKLEITKLQSQINEANKVIEFYGDPNSWISGARNESTEIRDDDKETNSLYAQKFTKEKPMSLFGKGDFIGGKRARETQKWVEEELAKIGREG
jgi:hypothetical protein